MIKKTDLVISYIRYPSLQKDLLSRAFFFTCMLAHAQIILTTQVRMSQSSKFYLDRMFEIGQWPAAVSRSAVITFFHPEGTTVVAHMKLLLGQSEELCRIYCLQTKSKHPGRVPQTGRSWAETLVLHVLSYYTSYTSMSTKKTTYFTHKIPKQAQTFNYPLTTHGWLSNPKM